MKKPDSIRLFASLLVLIFLAGFVVGFSSFRERGSDLHTTVFAKKPPAPATTDVQIQYLEREKEEENGADGKDKGNSFHLYCIEASQLPSFCPQRDHLTGFIFHELGDTSATPLYLIIRTLLI